MVDHRLTTWLRPLLHLLAIAGALSLAACGGGSGAPFQTAPQAPPAVTVQPATINVFSGTPATLTITSGSGGFNVFSDTPSVLPVAQVVSGNTIVLLANSVGADTPVNLTVTDVAGQTVKVPVVVKPAPLFNSLTFAPSGTDCGSDLCSAQVGTARVTAFAPGGAPLVGRQIRFEVVYGPVQFLTGNPAQPTAQTITVTTDNVGVAQIPVQAVANSTTQAAQIRATDVTSGNLQVSNFTVVNNTTATQSPIVVVPNSANITGPDTLRCSTGFRIDYYIYGGTPPYTIQSTFPQAVSLSTNVVTSSGGYFSATTNGSCVNPLVFTISDAAGKQTTANLVNIPGTTAPPTPTPPPPVASLAVLPGAVTDVCGTGKTYGFIITGGSPAYNVSSVVNPGLPAGDSVVVNPQIVSGNGGTFTVTTTGPAIDFANKVITIVILDSSATQQQTTARITCTP